MDVVSRQPIAGAEGFDIVQRFVLKALAPFELGLLARPADQKVAHYRRY